MNSRLCIGVLTRLASQVQEEEGMQIIKTYRGKEISNKWARLGISEFGLEFEGEGQFAPALLDLRKRRPEEIRQQETHDHRFSGLLT